MGVIGTVGGFIIGVWNFVVSVFPTVLHTACQLTEGASKAVTLTTGGSP